MASVTLVGSKNNQGLHEKWICSDQNNQNVFFLEIVEILIITLNAKEQKCKLQTCQIAY